MSFDGYHPSVLHRKRDECVAIHCIVELACNFRAPVTLGMCVCVCRCMFCVRELTLQLLHDIASNYLGVGDVVISVRVGYKSLRFINSACAYINV